ncbi:MAG: hydroxyacylglutathione hydrolase [Pseudomonadota bacterium]|nr:hydroxyacylglutathione hydrolase [Pseudomonadota bacterium]
MQSIQINAIPILTDNYVWAIQTKTGLCLIDPGEASPVQRWLSNQRLTPSTILITHHHPDHVGGVETLKKYYPNITIYGPQHSLPFECTDTQSIAEFTDPVTQLKWKTHRTPGHTLDHICYQTGHHLFCGDLLFLAGCGRLFEGTAEQMYASIQAIVQLPKSTLLYPAHEYSLSNLTFAAHVEPNNPIIQDEIKRCNDRRDRQLPTLPTSIQQELNINPFLRLNSPEVYQFATQSPYYSPPKHPSHKTTALFSSLRQAKDHYP